MKQSIVVAAFASAYNYIQAADLLVKKPGNDVDSFFKKVRDLSKQYLTNQYNDFEWRTAVNNEYLSYFRQNDMFQLMEYIDFNKLKKEIDFKNKGRGRVIVETPLNFTNQNLKLKTQIIGVQKGYAIPPHIHENMSSASLILSGKMLLSHYNRLETHKDFVMVEKDSEVYQKPGDWSIVSPIKNNLHWFKAYEADTYMLNINVEGLQNKKAKPGIRVDIEQSDTSQNRYKATIISDEEAQIKYGKL